MSKTMILTKKRYAGVIFFIIHQDSNYTYSKEITKKKLLFKEKYYVQNLKKFQLPPCIKRMIF